MIDRPKNIKTDWHFHSSGKWMHRPRWKVIVNKLLRAVQRGPVKYVVYTKTAETRRVKLTVLANDMRVGDGTVQMSWTGAKRESTLVRWGVVQVDDTLGGEATLTLEAEPRAIGYGFGPIYHEAER